MRLIPLIWLVMTVVVMPFARLPYTTIEPSSFELTPRYSGYSFDQSVGKPGIISINARFRFNDIFFSIVPQFIQIGSLETAFTYYQFGWFITEAVPLYKLRWSMQVGAYAIGFPSLIKAQTSPYRVDYALTHFFEWDGLPFFGVWGLYMNDNSDVTHGGAVGIAGQEQRLYVEYDGAMAQWYMGVDYDILDTVSGVMAINISSNQTMSGYNPSFVVGLTVTNLFIPKVKKAPQKPLPVDDASFLLMEKALLAFQGEDYTSAANYYRQVAKKYPNYELAYVRLGNSFYKLGQWELAEQAWSEALRINPNNNDVFMALMKLKNRTIQVNKIINSSSI
jgi:tetratricopeptide (TPR) repeat protein